jgi:hypothetical protein
VPKAIRVILEWIGRLYGARMGSVSAFELNTWRFTGVGPEGPCQHRRRSGVSAFENFVNRRLFQRMLDERNRVNLCLFVYLRVAGWILKTEINK